MLNAGFDLIAKANSIFPNAEDIQNSLLPSGWTALAHIVGTIIVIAIVLKLIWKPMMRTLNSRRQHIEKQIIEAEQLNSEAHAKRQAVQLQHDNSQLEAERTMEGARVEGYRIREQLEVEAKQYAARIRSDAHDDLRKTELQLRKDIKQEIVDIAILAAANMIETKLTEEQERKLISEFIDSLETTTLKAK